MIARPHTPLVMMLLVLLACMVMGCDGICDRGDSITQAYCARKIPNKEQ